MLKTPNGLECVGMASGINSFIRPTRACIGVFVALGLCREPIATPARADAADVARAALVAKATQRCPIAIGLFDEALRQGGFSTHDEGLLIYSRGVCYENLGVKQKALADLNSAIALLPDLADAYAYRGILWGELREFDRAIADLEQAKRIKPDDPLVLNNLGNAFAAKDQPAEAIANYTRGGQCFDRSECFGGPHFCQVAKKSKTGELRDAHEHGVCKGQSNLRHRGRTLGIWPRGFDAPARTLGRQAGWKSAYSSIGQMVTRQRKGYRRTSKDWSGGRDPRLGTAGVSRPARAASRGFERGRWRSDTPRQTLWSSSSRTAQGREQG